MELFFDYQKEFAKKLIDFKVKEVDFYTKSFNEMTNSVFAIYTNKANEIVAGMGKNAKEFIETGCISKTNKK
jgi:hypothetical protein